MEDIIYKNKDYVICKSLKVVTNRYNPPKKVVVLEISIEKILRGIGRGLLVDEYKKSVKAPNFLERWLGISLEGKVEREMRRLMKKAKTIIQEKIDNEKLEAELFQRVQHIE